MIWRPASPGTSPTSSPAGPRGSPAHPEVPVPAAIAAALLTLALLVPAELKTPQPMLLLGRFVPWGSWIEAGLLAAYAFAVAWLFRDPAGHARWRPRLWRLFSVVFFGQLALGLLGFERFLMSGNLHPPVPAVILAGPIYRGGGLFMVSLLLGTIVLVGPAWCSHLCYVGAWDELAAHARKHPGALPPWRHAARGGMLALVLGAALALRAWAVPPLNAALVALGFGAVGLGVTLVVSRRLGVMAHCTVFCPVGLVVDLLGRLNPFRVRIADGCTACGACSAACRYQALEPAHLAARRPGLTCTLCGECLPKCRQGFMHYHLPGLSPRTARIAFLALAAALHAVFLGLGRI